MTTSTQEITRRAKQSSLIAMTFVGGVGAIIAALVWTGSPQQGLLLGAFSACAVAVVAGGVLWLRRVEGSRLLKPDDKLQNKDAVVILTKSVFLCIVALYAVLAGTAACFPNQSHAVGLIVVWSLSGLAVGGFLGFLFGHPRIEENQATAEANWRRRLRSNTSLDQINDWLTKAIVGVGLVEAQRIGAYVSDLSLVLGKALGGSENPAQGQPIASGVLVLFPLVGFVSSYLVTRTFIAAALCRADVAAEAAIKATERIGIQQATTEKVASANRDVNRECDEISVADPETARKFQSLDLDELDDPVELVAWAKVQLQQGKSGEALKAVERAVALKPDDAAIALDHAHIAGRAGASPAERFRLLQRSHALLTRSSPPELREQIYNSLMYWGLYRTYAGACEEVIRYGEEYTSDPKNAPSGGVWVNLACAYGQRARVLKENGKGDTPEFRATRDKALGAVRSAVGISPQWSEKLTLLMYPNAPEKLANPSLKNENDLEVFASDGDFQALLPQPN
jgi:hypothetical protein